MVRKLLTVERDPHMREGKPVKGSTYKIKDVGALGRGEKVIPIEKGGMEGYSTNWNEEKRYSHLRMLIKKHTPLTVFRMLNAQVILRKRTKGKAYRVFLSDRDWIKRTYMD